ncbi:hypothetical protein SHK09_06205 [Polaribacter sp. PL03]|uniref:hypothetical protein n=1 Tax=Polaribacter sp. PL03 TaxID=3088353 RepID=UPI0029CC70F8|nr:hypothetical protein [Polaribacter sp. PL03]MDX6746376.1 hypothetical protein [Polaribacter sp. PL03]
MNIKTDFNKYYFEINENGKLISKLTSESNSIGKTNYLGNSIEFKTKERWWEKYQYSIIKNSKIIGSINFNWLLDSIITIDEKGLEKKYILKTDSFKQEFNLYDDNKIHLLKYKKISGDFSVFEINCEIIKKPEEMIDLNELVIYTYFPAFQIMHGTLINQMNGGG